MTGNHPLPSEGDDVFTKQVEPDRIAPTLDRDAMRTPQICQYKGARFIEYDKDGQTQKTKKQLFVAQAGRGPWFSLWGTLNLDSQLRQVRPGAIVRLRYLGQDDGAEGDRKPHLWEVTSTAASMPIIDKLRATEPWPRYEQQLVADIERAKAESLARRDAKQAADAELPPDPDDDFPF